MDLRLAVNIMNRFTLIVSCGTIFALYKLNVIFNEQYQEIIHLYEENEQLNKVIANLYNENEKLYHEKTKYIEEL